MTYSLIRSQPFYPPGSAAAIRRDEVSKLGELRFEVCEVCGQKRLDQIPGMCIVYHRQKSPFFSQLLSLSPHIILCILCVELNIFELSLL